MQSSESRELPTFLCTKDPKTTTISATGNLLTALPLADDPAVCMLTLWDRYITACREVAVVGAAARATWIGPVLGRLDSILALPQGWDGREAKRPRVWHAVEAFGFLQRVMREATALPSIVPLADGGVQVEWHQGGLDVEATFTAGPDRGLYFADLSNGYEFEGPVDTGIGELRGLITRLEGANTATTVHAAY